MQAGSEQSEIVQSGRQGWLARFVTALSNRGGRMVMRWAQKHIPPARHYTLTYKNIFILPNKQGLGFAFVLSLMFIGAVNYEANLAFALVFLLVGMFILSIFYTVRNLAGLRLSAVHSTSVFAGELAEITIIVNRQGKRCHESIRLRFPDSRQQVTDLIDTTEARLPLFVPATKRGYLHPGRLVIDTVFPFGICRAWSLIDLNVQCLVYPRPVECDIHWLLSQQADPGNTMQVRGSDDFYGLRSYQRGDPLKHVAWKNYARGQGMLVKEYASAMDQRIWLRWQLFADLDTEDRLSRLCWCVIHLDASGLEYGLDIPGTRINPARGEGHYFRVLHALALYGQQEA